MPDLSDKVSERPDDVSEDVWEAAFLVANNLNCDFSFDGQTGGHAELREAQADIARAIMADRRTRPLASSMEGWRLVPEEMTLAMSAAGEAEYLRKGLGVWSDFHAIYRAMLAASPIPPEVMK